MNRVYFPHGRVAHLLPPDRSPNDGIKDALCGLYPWPGAWWGTGSWKERAMAADMPTCRNCKAISEHLRAKVAPHRARSA